MSQLPEQASSHAETPTPEVVAVRAERNRVTLVAAWVGIVAGVVFIVAVVFFSGFILGRVSGGGGAFGGHGHHDMMFDGRSGPPMMGPGGPGALFGSSGPGEWVPSPPPRPPARP
ncbi:MAG: hypothetical protein WBB07_10170 [Mycobacterium sp.]